MFISIQLIPSYTTSSTSSSGKPRRETFLMNCFLSLFKSIEDGWYSLGEGRLLNRFELSYIPT